MTRQHTPTAVGLGPIVLPGTGEQPRKLTFAEIVSQLERAGFHKPPKNWYRKLHPPPLLMSDAQWRERARFITSCIETWGQRKSWAETWERQHRGHA